MPAPGNRKGDSSDGFVRGWHPDRRVGLPPTQGGKKCKHDPVHREELHNSNGDLIIHCQICDVSWWERAT